MSPFPIEVVIDHTAIVYSTFLMIIIQQNVEETAEISPSSSSFQIYTTGDFDNYQQFWTSQHPRPSGATPFSS